MPTFTFASALVAFQSLSIQSEAEKLQICFAFFLASFTSELLETKYVFKSLLSHCLFERTLKAGSSLMTC